MPAEQIQGNTSVMMDKLEYANKLESRVWDDNFHKVKKNLVDEKATNVSGRWAEIKSEMKPKKRG